MTPAGIEPATFRFVAQHLNHCDTAVHILLTSPNNIQMQSNLNLVYEQLNQWFKSNQLLLNFDITHFIQFSNKIKCTTDIQNNIKIKN